MGAAICRKDGIIKLKQSEQEVSNIGEPDSFEQKKLKQKPKLLIKPRPLNNLKNSSNQKNSPDQNISIQQKEQSLQEYHQKFSGSQICYFNKEELEYYKKYLEDHEKSYQTVQLKKTINCTKENLLGRGSYGNVYKGFDQNNRKIPMAIKTILRNNFQNEQSFEEFEQEVQLLTKLKHPNIVTLYGYKKTKQKFELYLEYMGQGSISDMLVEYKSFPQEITARYTKQILKGLEYLHSQNIVHRDLKGGNVLVDSEGNVKLGDFGSAKIIGNSYLQSLIGTACWMAPEIMKEIGHERFVDIWSLGCTVYEMLSGKPPFIGKNYYTTIEMVKNFKEEEFIYPENFSELAKDFISCCLKQIPYKRKNVYKLLRHPFLKIGKPLNEDDFRGDSLHFDNSPNNPSYFFKNNKKKNNQNLEIMSVPRENGKFDFDLNQEIQKKNSWRDVLKQQKTFITKEIEKIQKQKIKDKKIKKIKIKDSNEQIEIEKKETAKKIEQLKKHEKSPKKIPSFKKQFQEDLELNQKKKQIPNKQTQQKFEEKIQQTPRDLEFSFIKNNSQMEN